MYQSISLLNNLCSKSRGVKNMLGTISGDFQKSVGLNNSSFLIIHTVNTTINGWKSQVTLR